MQRGNGGQDLETWLMEDAISPEAGPDKTEAGAPLDEDGFSFFAAVVFTVNMVLGAGVVGLPYAFYHAGAWLSLTIMVLATLMSATTMGYIVEVLAWSGPFEEKQRVAREEQEQTARFSATTTTTRASQTTQTGEDDAAEHTPPLLADAAAAAAQAEAEAGGGDAAAGVGGGGVREVREGSCADVVKGLDETDDLELMIDDMEAPPDFHIRNTPELSELAGIFLGRVPRRLTELTITLYTLGTLWLYATVFASSLSLVAPIPLQGRPASIEECLVACDTRGSASSCMGGGCLWTNASSSTLDLALGRPGLPSAGLLPFGRRPNASFTGDIVVLSEKVSFVGEPDGIPPDPSLGGACSLDPEVRGYCEGSYSVFLLAFLVLQLFLSSIPLNALKNVQMLMGGISLTSMLAMFVTCVIAIDEDLGPDAGADMLPPTNMSSFGKLVTAALFSQICHQGVPTIVGVMRDKRQAKSVFRTSLAYTLCLYTLLCLATTYYFGPRTASIVTLNWEDYTGGAVNGTQRAWWATVISTAVLTFPVITVSAAFPLNLIPLASTLVQMLPDPFMDKVGRGLTTRVVRILLCVIPCYLAYLVHEVSKILEFNGMFGFVVAFFVPCFLHLAARSQAVSRWGDTAARTAYWSSPSSSKGFVRALLWVARLLAAYTLSQVLKDYSLL